MNSRIGCVSGVPRDACPGYKGSEHCGMFAQLGACMHQMQPCMTAQARMSGQRQCKAPRQTMWHTCTALEASTDSRRAWGLALMTRAACSASLDSFTSSVYTASPATCTNRIFRPHASQLGGPDLIHHAACWTLPGSCPDLTHTCYLLDASWQLRISSFDISPLCMTQALIWLSARGRASCLMSHAVMIKSTDCPTKLEWISCAFMPSLQHNGGADSERTPQVQTLAHLQMQAISRLFSAEHTSTMSASTAAQQLDAS